jgi:hypothetical protein
MIVTPSRRNEAAVLAARPQRTYALKLSTTTSSGKGREGRSPKNPMTFIFPAELTPYLLKMAL